MDKQDFKLLTVSVPDAELLSRTAIKAYSDHYLHLWYDHGKWYIKKSFSPVALEKEIADPNASFSLVCYKDAAVGFIKLNIDAAFEGYSAKQALELERIYLTGAASGKGIGTYLLQHILDFSKQRNKHLIWLKATDSSTQAINFYSANGFRVCGQATLDFKQMKEEFRGMVIMKRKI